MKQQVDVTVYTEQTLIILLYAVASCRLFYQLIDLAEDDPRPLPAN